MGIKALQDGRSTYERIKERRLGMEKKKERREGEGKRKGQAHWEKRRKGRILSGLFGILGMQTFYVQKLNTDTEAPNWDYAMESRLF